MLMFCHAAFRMSYTKHKSYIKNALKTAKVWSDKVTHTWRIYAAQLMVAFGVPIETIQQVGGWLQDTLGTAYVIFANNPEALLALGCWRLDKMDHQLYYDERWVWQLAVHNMSPPSAYLVLIVQ